MSAAERVEPDQADAPRARAVPRLVRRTLRDSREDRILGIAAEIAFFALLSIPSVILVVAGSAGFVGSLFGADVRSSLQSYVVDALGSFLNPETMADLIGPAVNDLFDEGRGGLLTIGALLAVWSVSRMMKVLIEGINIAYDVDEWRPGWRRRAVALGMTVAAVGVMIVVIPLLVAGPRLGEIVVDRYPLPAFLGPLWQVLYWPFAGAVGIALLTSIYHVAPNRHTPWRHDLPGAVVAAGVWIAAAFGLRVYVAVAFSETVAGPLAAPMILLLWLYVSGLAVLIGAEINSELDKMRAERPRPPESGDEAEFESVPRLVSDQG